MPKILGNSAGYTLEQKRDVLMRVLVYFFSISSFAQRPETGRSSSRKLLKI
jgi:hypothetical protein